jgi:hypothetical protein
MEGCGPRPSHLSFGSFPGFELSENIRSPGTRNRVHVYSNGTFGTEGTGGERFPLVLIVPMRTIMSSWRD